MTDNPNVGDTSWNRLFALSDSSRERDDLEKIQNNQGVETAMEFRLNSKDETETLNVNNLYLRPSKAKSWQKSFHALLEGFFGNIGWISKARAAKRQAGVEKVKEMLNDHYNQDQRDPNSPDAKSFADDVFAAVQQERNAEWAAEQSAARRRIDQKYDRQKNTVETEFADMKASNPARFRSKLLAVEAARQKEIANDPTINGQVRDIHDIVTDVDLGYIGQMAENTLRDRRVGNLHSVIEFAKDGSLGVALDSIAQKGINARGFEERDDSVEQNPNDWRPTDQRAANMALLSKAVDGFKAEAKALSEGKVNFEDCSTQFQMLCRLTAMGAGETILNKDDLEAFAQAALSSNKIWPRMVADGNQAKAVEFLQGDNDKEDYEAISKHYAERLGTVADAWYEDLEKSGRAQLITPNDVQWLKAELGRMATKTNDIAPEFDTKEEYHLEAQELYDLGDKMRNEFNQASKGLKPGQGADNTELKDKAGMSRQDVLTDTHIGRFHNSHFHRLIIQRQQHHRDNKTNSAGIMEEKLQKKLLRFPALRAFANRVDDKAMERKAQGVIAGDSDTLKQFVGSWMGANGAMNAIDAQMDPHFNSESAFNELDLLDEFTQFAEEFEALQKEHGENLEGASQKELRDLRYRAKAFDRRAKEMVNKFQKGLDIDKAGNQSDLVNVKLDDDAKIASFAIVLHAQQTISEFCDPISKGAQDVVLRNNQLTLHQLPHIQAIRNEANGVDMPLGPKEHPARILSGALQSMDPNASVSLGSFNEWQTKAKALQDYAEFARHPTKSQELTNLERKNRNRKSAMTGDDQKRLKELGNEVKSLRQGLNRFVELNTKISKEYAKTHHNKMPSDAERFFRNAETAANLALERLEVTAVEDNQNQSNDSNWFGFPVTGLTNPPEPDRMVAFHNYIKGIDQAVPGGDETSTNILTGLPSNQSILTGSDAVWDADEALTEMAQKYPLGPTSDLDQQDYQERMENLEDQVDTLNSVAFQLGRLRDELVKLKERVKIADDVPKLSISIREPQGVGIGLDSDQRRDIFSKAIDTITTDIDAVIKQHKQVEHAFGEYRKNVS